MTLENQTEDVLAIEAIREAMNMLMHETSADIGDEEKAKQVRETLTDAFFRATRYVSRNKTQAGLDQIIRGLDAKEPEIRSMAIHTIGGIAYNEVYRKTAVTALIKTMKTDKEINLRREALDNLISLGAEHDLVILELGDTFVEILRGEHETYDEDNDKQHELLEMLYEAGIARASIAKTIVNILAQTLNNKDSHIRSRTIDIIGSIGANHENSALSAAKALAKVKDNKSAAATINIIKIAGLYQESEEVAAHALKETLENNDSIRTRVEAAYGLGIVCAKIPDGDPIVTLASDTLIKVLDDESYDVRTQAIYGLGAIGRGHQSMITAITNGLKQRLKNEPDKYIVEKLTGTLGTIKKSQPNNTQPPVNKILRTQLDKIREQASKIPEPVKIHRPEKVLFPSL